MVFEAVGPGSFHVEDWGIFGLDQSPEAAAGLFSVMSGQALTPEDITSGAYLDAVKPISADRWVTKDTVPSVLCYGAHDKMQPFAASKPLVAALEKNGVDYRYFVAKHSGHGLQNDNKVYMEYLDAVFNVVIGIEFLKMLCKPSSANIIEVLIFLIARHMIVQTTTPLEDLLSVVSIGILFFFRRFMLMTKPDKDQHVPKLFGVIKASQSSGTAQAEHVDAEKNAEGSKGAGEK